MNTTDDLKQTLHNAINHIDDEQFLQAVKQLLDQKQARIDWWDEIPDHVKESINRAKKQLDNGKGIPDKQVRKEINERFFS